MKNMIKIHFSVLVLALSLLVGCDKDTDQPQQAGPMDVVVPFATPPAADRTFRILCYDANNANFGGAGQQGTGTYRYDTDRQYLVPCQVDPLTGNQTGTDGSNYALVNGGNSAYCVMVSPAKMFEAGTFNYYNLTRDQEFWATSSKSFAMQGYKILDFNEPLKDVRSRFAFSFHRGANKPGLAISVANLTLKDAGSQAKWVPNTGAAETSGADPVIPLHAATPDEIAATPNVLFVNTNPEYVFSSTYGSNNVKTIKIDFQLTVNGVVTQERYPLAIKAERMKYYKFEFTITSTNIDLVLTVFDLGGNNHQWQSGVVDTDELGNPEATITLQSWTIGNNWDDGGGGSDVIE